MTESSHKNLALFETYETDHSSSMITAKKRLKLQSHTDSAFSELIQALTNFELAIAHQALGFDHSNSSETSRTSRHSLSSNHSDDTGALDSGALDSGALDSGALDSDTSDSGATDSGATERSDSAIPSSEFLPGDKIRQETLKETTQIASKIHEIAKRALTYCAGWIDEESHHSLQNSGIQTRAGYKTSLQYLSALTGIRRKDAAEFIQNGKTLLATERLKHAEQHGKTPDSASQTYAGLQEVSEAYKKGKLTGGQLAEIEKQLRSPHLDLSVKEQRQLGTELIEDASQQTVEELSKTALRKATKRTTISLKKREEAALSRRYISIGPLEDGLHSLHGLITPIMASLFNSITEYSTNPRIIDRTLKQLPPEQRQRYKNMTAGQRRHDAIFDRVKAGHEATALPINNPGNQTPTALPRSNRSTVIVTITAEDLRNQEGTGHILDSGAEITSETVKQLMCDAEIFVNLVDTKHNPLYLGRTQRTFSTAQRLALSHRDGGCRWPGCGRPLSYCEAHHIIEWEQGGKTDIDNGLMLCHQHHMQLHQQQYEILRTDQLANNPAENIHRGTTKRDRTNRGETGHHSINRDLTNKGSADKDSANRGSANRGSANRGSANRGSANRGSANRVQSHNDPQFWLKPPTTMQVPPKDNIPMPSKASWHDPST